MLRNKGGHHSEKPEHHKEQQPPLAPTRESLSKATKTQYSLNKLKNFKKQTRGKVLLKNILLSLRFCSRNKLRDRHSFRQYRIQLQSRRPRFDPWAGKIPWKREWLPTPVFLPGEFHGQRSLAGYSPWGRNELDTTEQLTLSPLLHRAPEPHAPREDAMRSRQPATSKRALTRA